MPEFHPETHPEIDEETAIAALKHGMAEGGEEQKQAMNLVNQWYGQEMAKIGNSATERASLHRRLAHIYDAGGNREAALFTLQNEIAELQGDFSDQAMIANIDEDIRALRADSNSSKKRKK